MTDQSKLLPTLERVLYDELFGTDTRFGLGPEQIFVDADLAKSTITSILVDPDREFPGVDIDDFVNNVLNFDTPEDIINTMNTMYNSFQTEDLNYIFFQILSDAFVNKKEFEEIFKTSWVALQIRQNVDTPQPIVPDSLNLQPGGGCFTDPPVTPTITPSVTASVPLPTISPSPTFSPTPSPTLTVTPTNTPTISVTPSVTPSTTVTPTFTPTSTVTPTVTASVSPTVTPTVTPSPTS